MKSGCAACALVAVLINAASLEVGASTGRIPHATVEPDAPSGGAVRLRSPSSSQYILSGTTTSHLRLSKWIACAGSRLSFQFETSQPNGLLLYADDEGHDDFFELKLVDGRLKARMRVGGGESDGSSSSSNRQSTAISQTAGQLEVGEGLNDRLWHRVEVAWLGHELAVGVDSTYGRWRPPANQHSAASTPLIPWLSSYLYMGGLPSDSIQDNSKLTLPTAPFERRFAGRIDNITYSGACQEDDRDATAAKLLGFGGLRTRTEDFCQLRNPCLHNGLCLNTDSEPVCDCTHTRYEGRHCTREKVPLVASFTGQEHIIYNFSSRLDPIVTRKEVIELWIKTRQPNVFLIMLVDGADYLYVGLRDGAPFVMISLGSKMEQAHVKDARVDDDQWHQLTITRDARELTADKGVSYVKLLVDGQLGDTRSLTGSFSALSSRVIYLAGAANRPATVQPAPSFSGCIKHVSYAAQTSTIDLLRLAKDDNKLVQKRGAITFNHCQTAIARSEGIFVSKELSIALPRWAAAASGAILLSFTTTVQCGLLVYQSRTPTKSDMFAIEIVDGMLFVLFDLGSGVTKVRASEQPVNDGREHTISIHHNGRAGSLLFDRSRRTYVIDSAASGSTSSSDGVLDSAGQLFIAGYSSNSAETAPLPPELWSTTLKCFFTGCIHQLSLNGAAIDIAKAGQEQDVHVLPFCPALESRCASQPCDNGGRCLDVSDRYVCDCTFTDYTGHNCSERQTAMLFNGDHYYRINFKKMMTTQAEDLVVRFRTKQSYGRLLATVGDSSSDRLEMSILTGRLLITLKLGGTSKLIQIGESLNDNRYHTVKLSRRARLINMTLDHITVTEEMMEGDRLTLPIREIHIASYDNDGGLSLQTNFVGHIQKVVLNGVDMIHLLHSQTKRYETDTNAVFDDNDPAVRLPVSFTGPSGHISLPTLTTYPTLSLFFQFRTTAADGLLLYNGGRGGDFFIVELVKGAMRVMFRKGSALGDSIGSSLVFIESSAGVADGRWHDVTITRSVDGRVAMRIDWSEWLKCNGTCGSVSGHQPQPVTYDLSGPLYVGGMPTQAAGSVALQLGRQTQPPRGFMGCLGSLDINGMRPNLVTDGGSKFSALIQSGCSAFDALCVEETCRNGGVCNHGGSTKDLCNCDATSFTGPICSDDSTTYLFGGLRPGVIGYVVPPEQRQDTREDKLAFGFLSHSNNSVIFRATSGNSIDYIEVRIKDGYVYIVYNVGAQDHPITDALHPVVDGKYHVVRFERRGANATLQLDNRPSQVKVPADDQPHIFNNVAYISIGGRLDFDRLTITQPFKGLVSGLVFNKLRLLDRAKDNHSFVRLMGDIRQEDLQSTRLSAAAPWRTADPAKSHGSDIILASGDLCMTGCSALHGDGYSSSRDNLIVPTVTVVKPAVIASSTKFPHPHPQSHGDQNVDAKAALSAMVTSLSRTELSRTPASVSPGSSRELAGADDGETVEPEGDGSALALDLMKNIPLVAGVSGAAILTVLLIVIVACKLTRKEGGAYKVKKTVTLDEGSGLPCASDGKQPAQTSSNSRALAAASSSSGASSNGCAKGVREWYV